MIGQYDENGDPVAGTGNNSIITTNNGTVVSNNSAVVKNNGTVASNTGRILQNMQDGNVTNEAGGKVILNFGTVDNSGTVEYNNSRGTVDNREGGVVVDNYGKVYNYGGTIKNNRSNGTEYFTVDVKAKKASSKRGDGFSSHNDQDNWLSNGDTGTITIKPKKGYSIKDIDLPEGVTAKKNKNGSWTLTVSGIQGHILLEPTVLKDKASKGKSKSTKSKKAVSLKVSVATLELSFDLGGGTVDGSAEALKLMCAPGQVIELPAAPEREGFVFAGWETEMEIGEGEKIGVEKESGEEKEKVVFQPGERFEVIAARSFTALWIAEEEAAEEPAAGE